MRNADGLPVERVFKDENLVHAQGVSDKMQRLVDPFVHVVHAEEDIDDVHHDTVADGVDGEGADVWTPSASPPEDWPKNS